MKSNNQRLDEIERKLKVSAKKPGQVYVLRLEGGSIFRTIRERRPGDPRNSMFVEDIDWDI